MASYIHAWNTRLQLITPCHTLHHLDGGGVEIRNQYIFLIIQTIKLRKIVHVLNFTKHQVVLMEKNLFQKC